MVKASSYCWAIIASHPPRISLPSISPERCVPAGNVTTATCGPGGLSGTGIKPDDWAIGGMTPTGPGTCRGGANWTGCGTEGALRVATGAGVPSSDARIVLAG